MNINQASKEELDGLEPLKGHGHEIVRFREERGGFPSLRELEEVPGLTGKLDLDELERLGLTAA
jgi:competence protein ComEA